MTEASTFCAIAMTPSITGSANPTSAFQRLSEPEVGTPSTDPTASNGILDWDAAHQVIICKNYSVISTRKWLFNHTRTLSIINNLGGRLKQRLRPPKAPANPWFRCVFAKASLQLPLKCTLLYVQLNLQSVPRGTLYVQLLAAA